MRIGHDALDSAGRYYPKACRLESYHMHTLYFTLIPSIAALCEIAGNAKATEAAEVQLTNTVHSALGQYKFEQQPHVKGKESAKFAQLKFGKVGVKGRDTVKVGFESKELKEGTTRPLALYMFTRDSLVFSETWGVFPPVPAELAEWVKKAAGLTAGKVKTGETVNA